LIFRGIHQQLLASFGPLSILPAGRSYSTSLASFIDACLVHLYKLEFSTFVQEHFYEALITHPNSLVAITDNENLTKYTTQYYITLVA
jgi:hypothetical protein